jgi:hypothetical protein
MRSTLIQRLMCLFLVAGCASLTNATATKPLATVESVTVTSAGGGISVEIAASAPSSPRTQVVTDPDRLILDFSNAQPATGLRSKLLNQGDIKGYRVARYSDKPPVTRVVIDLNSPQHYEIFPDGKTVIVKLRSDEQQAAIHGTPNNASTPPAPAKPKLTVDYSNGRMTIAADKASLADVLNEVHRQTATEIPIPPGAAQEQIVANIGPLPLREALVSLLNGSRFNFILVDSDREPGKLKTVILSYRGGSGIVQPMATGNEPAVTDSTPAPDQSQETQPEIPTPPEIPPQQEGQSQGQSQPDTTQPQDLPQPQ